jgi:hypothetical protein
VNSDEKDLLMGDFGRDSAWQMTLEEWVTWVLGFDDDVQDVNFDS